MDDGKLEDSARDRDLALLSPVKAFMTSSLTHRRLSENPHAQEGMYVLARQHREQSAQPCF